MDKHHEEVYRTNNREKPDENVGYESFDDVVKAPLLKQDAQSEPKPKPAKNKPQETSSVKGVTKKTKPVQHNFRGKDHAESTINLQSVKTQFQ